jgi:hypothetical protein
LRLRRLEFLHLTGNRSSFVMCLRRYMWYGRIGEYKP